MVAGCFRLVLTGALPVTVVLDASRLLVLNNTPGYTLAFEREPQDLIFRANSTTTAWYDVLDR